MTEINPQLLQQLRARNVLIIFGAGVTIAATGNAQLSWPALLRRGAEYVDAHGLAPTENWGSAVKFNLDSAGSAGSNKLLLTAAELVKDALTVNGGQAFTNWLDGIFADLPVTSPRILESLGALGVPLVTTNYDTTLEDFLGWTSVHQENPSMVLRALDSSTRTVLVHLHGVWTEPDTIVLSTTDYAHVANDSGTGALLRAALIAKTVLYVGFGEGLSDPNFASAQQWIQDRVGPTNHRHFRLCLDSELEQLRRLHVNDNIEPVAYGDAHEKLPDFLAELQQFAHSTNHEMVPVPLEQAAELAKAAISLRVHEEAVINALVEQTGDPLELLIPPVLLPVPHDAYLIAQQQQDAPDIPRVDLHAERESQGPILLVGERDSGLTSALRWLVLQRAKHAPEGIPLIVNGRNIKWHSKQPLSDELRREASKTGVVPTPKSALPPLVVGVDDLELGVKPAPRFLKDLQELNPIYLVMACRPGEEESISKVFKESGMEISVRFLGRMDAADIFSMAKMIDPVGAKALTDSALKAITMHGLKRTPYNVALLLTLLNSGDLRVDNPTQVSLVGQYVSMAMARWSLEPQRRNFETPDLEDILEHFAATLADLKLWRMTLGDFFNMLKDYMEQVGWNFDGVAALDSLLAMRILRAHDNHVSFTQTAFLYCFAARKAVKDQEFRSRILLEPDIYERIVIHYASINRGDAQLLSFVHDLVAEMCFDEDEGSAPAQDPRRDGQVGDQTEDDAEFSTSTSIDRWMSRPDEWNEAIVFYEPTEDEIPVRGPWRYPRLLNLATGVLRELDLVKNPDLKRRALQGTLTSLARIGPAMLRSEDFAAYRKMTVELIRDVFIGSERSRDLVADLFAEAMPSIYSFASAYALSNPKLHQVLLDLLADPEFKDDSDAYNLGLALLFFIGKPGYGSYLRRHAESNPPCDRATAQMLRNSVMFAYLAGRVPGVDVGDVERYLAVTREEFDATLPNLVVKNIDQAWIQNLRRVRLQRSQGGSLGGAAASELAGSAWE